jgi:hypothetical protein
MQLDTRWLRRVREPRASPFTWMRSPEPTPGGRPQRRDQSSARAIHFRLAPASVEMHHSPGAVATSAGKRAAPSRRRGSGGVVTGWRAAGHRRVRARPSARRPGFAAHGSLPAGSQAAAATTPALARCASGTRGSVSAARRSRNRSISVRSSVCRYSHWRETPAWRATAWKVIVTPCWSSSRRASRARA